MVNYREKNGRTPLYYAISKNQYDMCEILLRNGADCYNRDKFGRTM